MGHTLYRIARNRADLMHRAYLSLSRKISEIKRRGVVSAIAEKYLNSNTITDNRKLITETNEIKRLDIDFRFQYNM